MRTENPKHLEQAVSVLNRMESQGYSIKSACLVNKAKEITVRTVINRHPELRQRYEAWRKNRYGVKVVEKTSVAA